MHVLWIELDGFYASHHEVGNQPLIVTRNQFVRDANPVAKQRGVKPGMAIRQAKAILLQTMVKEWQSDTYESRSTEWLDVCTDYTGLIEPIDQHIAALDLTGHPDPLDVTEQLIRALATKTSLQIRYGAAPSKWIARLAMEHEDCGIALSNPASFLGDLSVAELLPVASEIREKLQFLGYRTIREVAQIPLSVLQGQFGAEGLTVLRASQGKLSDPVEASYPKAAIRECFLPKGEIDNLEVLDQCLQMLSQRIGKRLLRQGQCGARLEIQMDQLDDIPFRVARRLTKPIFNPTSALVAIRLLANDRTPDSLSPRDERGNPGPVTRIQITLSELEKAKPQQARFKGLEITRPKVIPALKLIRSTFGEKAVVLGSEIQVPRQVRVLREWRRATGWH